MDAAPELSAPRRATVLNIQRMSTEDGPGIRTTVFLKGCSLACRWCHNPESIDAAAQVVWNDHKCMGCGGCLEVCPQGALSTPTTGATGAGPIRRADTCRACGACVQECPTTAMELLGEPWELEDLVEEVAKDHAYFETSGGGITLSGGEPALQAAFCAAFAQRLRARSLHVAVDTCGQCSEARLLSLVEHADLVLYDLKTVDPALHERLTGQDNRRILSNLAGLIRHLESDDGPRALWIRTPLIPDETDTEDNLRALGEHLAAIPRGRVSRWELSAFNNLCADKYRRLGRPWPYAGVKPQSPERLARLGEVARASGVDPTLVHVPGAADSER